MDVLAGDGLEEVHIVADMAIAAPAEDVWRLVGAFADPALGRGFVTHVELEGEGVGAIRVLHFSDGVRAGVVRERQAARDERGRYYAYELDDAGDLPFTDYYASAQVAAVDKSNCRVIWLNRYRTPASLVPEMRKQSRLLLELIERNIKSELAAQTAQT